MRSQVMCQLGSNLACFTIDGTEHNAPFTVGMLQDVISSLLSVSQDIWMYGLICSNSNVIIFSIFGASSLILGLKLIVDCRNQF